MRRTLAILGAALIVACGFPATGLAQAHEQSGGHVARTAAPSSYALGVAELKAGKFQQAENAFRAAIKNKDHLGDAWGGLGYAALYLLDYMTAFEAFKKAHDLRPRNNDYTYRAAYSALYAGDYHAAVNYVNIFLKHQPLSAAGYHLRFLADGKLQLPKQEVVDAQMVVRLEPKSGPAYNDWGIALGNVGKYRKAIAAFTQALRLEPSNPLYYENRGVVENLNHQTALALADLKIAYRLTKDPQIRQQLAAVISSLEKQLHK